MTASQAERLYRALRTDIDKTLEEVRDQVAAVGAPESLELLAKIIGEFRGGPYENGYDEPMRATFDQAVAEVKAAMIELGADPRAFDDLWVTATEREHAVTGIRAFDDGSAVIWVAHSLIELAGVFLRYAAVDISRVSELKTFRRIWHLTRLEARGKFLGHTPTLSGMVRFNLVLHRCTGKPATLPMGRVDKDDLVGEYLWNALLFLLGHEIAHRVLGHPAKQHGFAPDRLIPACSPDQERELAADRLGFQAAVQAAKNGNPVPDLMPDWAVAGSVLIGALGAQAAVHAEERALFIRQGHSHPRAKIRAAALMKEAGPIPTHVANMMLPEALAAIRTATDFSPSGEPFDWYRLNRRRYPLIESRLSDLHRLVNAMDQIQCRPERVLVDGLRQMGTAAARGADLVHQGKVHDALIAWGVDAPEAAAILDSDGVVAFHGVVEALQEAFERSDMPEEFRPFAPIGAARVVEMQLAAGRENEP
jgi:hypothetical protein